MALLAPLLAFSLSAQAAEDHGGHFAVSDYAADPAYQAVGPQDPGFLYEGRFDFTRADAPSMIWQASRIRAEFEGQQLAMRFEVSSGSVFLDVEVDGNARVLELQKGDRRYTLQGDLSPGRHSLLIFKRSEASVGTCKFKGIEIQPGSQIFTPDAEYSSRIIFFGDSISAGACDEDGATDQWTDFSTHNAAKSYATLVGRALRADYQNISVSGMGMVTGWTTIVYAPQIWNRLTFNARGPKADLEAWRPDMVFINLGENDGSFSAAQGKAFPPNFADKYIAYVKSIKSAWPKAHIILLRGGMYNGSQNQSLIAAWNQVVESFVEDPSVHSYAFTHWSMNHPRARDHEILASELIAWLKSQDALRDYLPR